ncbi:MAG: leucine-rich repeat domain-containing protein [Clostridia bacterium]|nr:leucine-rich repeat domain-containing protein [Clostridia bacterium]
MYKDRHPLDLPETDALTLRLQGLGGKVKAPAALTAAAISGVPYRPRAYAGIHVRRISKAVVAYAMGIVFLFVGIFFATRLLESADDPVGTDPTNSLPPVVTTTPPETEDPPDVNEPVTTPDPGLSFVLMTDGYYAISDYDDSQESEQVVIPATYKDTPVKYVLNSAFLNSDDLKSVIIQDGITYIGANAFEGCTDLSEIRLPVTLTDLGKNAFYGCGLKSVTIPGSVETVMEGVFTACTSLTTVTVETGVKALSESAFQNCHALHTVTLPETLQRIDTAAFYKCEALKEITLPASLAQIGKFAFQYSGLTRAHFNETAYWSVTADLSDPAAAAAALTETFATVEWTKEDTSADPDLVFRKLDDGTYGVFYYDNRNATTVTIPATYKGIDVTAVCEAAFMECGNLRSVTLSEGLRIIEDQAFLYCPKLTTVNFPSTLTAIGQEAFYGCAVKSLTLPGSLAEMGALAFGECTDLTTLVLKTGIVEIGEMAFSGCTALRSVTFPSTLEIIDSAAFSSCTALESVDLPDGLQEIGGNAFSQCKGLNSIILPDSVTTLGTGAFEYCSNLKSVTLSENLTEIPIRLFKDCIALGTLSLPDGITKICDEAFYNCPLKSLTLPSGLTTIGSRIFFNGRIESITIPVSVTAISAGAFSFMSTRLKEVTFESPIGWNVDADLSDPAVAAEALTDTFAEMTWTWSDPTSKYLTYQMQEDGTWGVTGYEDKNAAKVTIPATYQGVAVTVIGESAFEGMENLQSITIPGSIRTIGARAFLGCTALTKITLPHALEIIGDWAFAESGLRSVTVPGSVNALSEYAFAYCPSLKTVELGNSGIRSIGVCAFASCTALTTIDFPNTLNTVQAGAFTECGSLKRIDWAELPIETVDDYVFSGCDDLVYVALPEIECVSVGLFEYCSSLQTVIIPDTVKTILSDAFRECSSLQKIDLAAVREIGQYAFASCGLESITIPSTVKRIFPNAFHHCYNNLYDVTFETQQGWVVVIDGMSADGIRSMGTLSNARNNARYLVETYLEYEWNCYD